MRNEIVRQHIEDPDTDAEVGDMSDDFHETHFEGERREKDPEPTAKAYYDMLTAAQEPLHGHTKVSQLDAIAVCNDHGTRQSYHSLPCAKPGKHTAKDFATSS